jgi:hypothetical protein
MKKPGLPGWEGPACFNRTRASRRSGRGRGGRSGRSLGRNALGDHATAGAAAADAAIAAGTATTDAAAVGTATTDAAAVSTATTNATARAGSGSAAAGTTNANLPGAAARPAGSATARLGSTAAGIGRAGRASGSAGRAGVAAASRAARGLTAATAETAGGRSRVGGDEADDEREEHRNDRGETLHKNLQGKDRTPVAIGGAVTNWRPIRDGYRTAAHRSLKSAGRRRRNVRQPRLAAQCSDQREIAPPAKPAGNLAVRGTVSTKMGNLRILSGFRRICRLVFGS